MPFDSRQYFVGNKHIRVLPSSLYMISVVKTSKILAILMRNVINLVDKSVLKSLKILDMTANHGGDVTGFLAFNPNSYITAIELSAEIFENLKYNMCLYANYRDRYTLINGDSIDWLSKNDKTFNAIIIDPPFDFDIYYEYQKQGIKYIPKMNGMPIYDIVVKFARRSPFFVLKLPKDIFDIDTFIDKSNELFKILFMDREKLSKLSGNNIKISCVILVSTHYYPDFAMTDDIIEAICDGVKYDYEKIENAKKKM